MQHHLFTLFDCKRLTRIPLEIFYWLKRLERRVANVNGITVHWMTGFLFSSKRFQSRTVNCCVVVSRRVTFPGQIDVSTFITKILHLSLTWRTCVYTVHIISCELLWFSRTHVLSVQEVMSKNVALRDNPSRWISEICAIHRWEYRLSKWTYFTPPFLEKISVLRPGYGREKDIMKRPFSRI